MGNFFSHLFGKDFIPHGHCYLWRPDVIWLEASSDSLIALAYLLIPIGLVYLVRLRRDLVFHWMFWMFAAFILLCGSTHVMNVVTLWDPYYRLEGLIKLITGIVSLTTAFCLFPIVPRILALPKPEELAAANRALAAQVESTRNAEEKLRQLNAELERRVAERTAALKRSNEDLAQFAYVASHDLQEPLRMVSAYTSLLKRRYGDDLCEEAHTFMNFADSGAKRMHQLVSDLLTYAQIDNHDGKLVQRFSARRALDQAIDSLRLNIEREEALIDVSEMPEIVGDEAQIAQVFQNLLSNSLKYRSKAPPRIQIWAESLEENPGENPVWRFYVKDNGIGFDMRYRERLFNMFQRLKKDRPGTGIGLAICKKIVSRHGGTIDVQSKPGGGTTFSFTLPATVATPKFI